MYNHDLYMYMCVNVLYVLCTLYDKYDFHKKARYLFPKFYDTYFMILCVFLTLQYEIFHSLQSFLIILRLIFFSPKNINLIINIITLNKLIINKDILGKVQVSTHI